MSEAEAVAARQTEGLQALMQASSVHYTTVSELAYSVLRQAILNGTLAPGQPLRQDSLARALGVSPVPVRSALQQLEAEGLITNRPHRGAIVSTLTAERIRHIYEARIVLESHALRKAIRDMTPERLERLEALAAKVDSTASGEAFVQARVEFYRTLYGVAGNELITAMIERLRSDVGRFWLQLRVAHGHDPQHARLLDYVRSRNAEAATDWLREHLSQVAEELALRIDSPETK